MEINFKFKNCKGDDAHGFYNLYIIIMLTHGVGLDPAVSRMAWIPAEFRLISESWVGLGNQCNTKTSQLGCLLFSI